MRKALLLVAVVLLSGCTLPGEDDDEETPAAFGACPHWLAGPDTVQASLHTGNGTATFTVTATQNGTGEAEVAIADDGRLLDMFLLRVNTTAQIELRVFALREDGAERLAIHHLESGTWQARPFLALEGDQEVQVYLADTSFEAVPSPSSLRIQVEAGDGDAEAVDVGLEVTPFYRVCGVPLQDPTSVP